MPDLTLSGAFMPDPKSFPGARPKAWSVQVCGLDEQQASP